VALADDPARSRLAKGRCAAPLGRDARSLPHGYHEPGAVAGRIRERQSQNRIRAADVLLPLARSGSVVLQPDDAWR
jgi:hypothetical protein